MCSEECVCACRHSWKVFRQVSHSSARMKYGAVYSCCRGLRESDQRGFRLAAQQRLLFPRGCTALPRASALTVRSIAMPIQSGGPPGGLHSCLLPSCLLLCYLLSPLVFAVEFGFLWVLFFVFFSFLFKTTHCSSSTFKKGKKMFTDLNFGS